MTSLLKSSNAEHQTRNLSNVKVANLESRIRRIEFRALLLARQLSVQSEWMSEVSCPCLLQWRLLMQPRFEAVQDVSAIPYGSLRLSQVPHHWHCPLRTPEPPQPRPPHWTFVPQSCLAPAGYPTSTSPVPRQVLLQLGHHSAIESRTGGKTAGSSLSGKAVPTPIFTSTSASVLRKWKLENSRMVGLHFTW